MRILEKQAVDKQKALERKKEVDEGLKLAKTVDNLRQKKSEEESNLRKFRDQSLITIKSDIDAKVVERDTLVTEVAQLHAKRLEELAPIDLSREWKKIETSKKDIEKEKHAILDRETQISVKEIALIDLDTRLNALTTREKDIELHLSHAKANYDKTEQIRSQIEDKKKQVETEINKKYSDIDIKEQDLVSREYVVNQKKDEISKELRELVEKGTQLIEREITLQAKTEELFKREIEIKEMESLTSRYATEAHNNYKLSENLKVEAKNIKDSMENESDNRFRVISDRERELSYKEHDLLLEKEKIEQDKKDIENEKIHTASQQETLRQAWNSIKKLNDKK